MGIIHPKENDEYFRNSLLLHPIPVNEFSKSLGNKMDISITHISDKFNNIIGYQSDDMIYFLNSVYSNFIKPEHKTIIVQDKRNFGNIKLYYPDKKLITVKDYIYEAFSAN